MKFAWIFQWINTRLSLAFEIFHFNWFYFVTWYSTFFFHDSIYPEIPSDKNNFILTKMMKLMDEYSRSREIVSTQTLNVHEMIYYVDCSLKENENYFWKEMIYCHTMSYWYLVKKADVQTSSLKVNVRSHSIKFIPRAIW